MDVAADHEQTTAEAHERRTLARRRQRIEHGPDGQIGRALDRDRVAAAAVGVAVVPAGAAAALSVVAGDASAALAIAQARAAAASKLPAPLPKVRSRTFALLCIGTTCADSLGNPQ